MKRIKEGLKSTLGAIKSYPISIMSALGFTAVTLIRIYMEWPVQEVYNFLFNCLHLTFGFGATFGLMIIALERLIYKDKKEFEIVNYATLFLGMSIFWLLYNYGGIERTIGNTTLQYVSQLAQSRMLALFAISGIGFVYALKKSDEQSIFCESLFMVQKAFIIAMFYGLIVMMGTSAVAGAIQALLFDDMSEKVFMVLAALSGLFSFMIFVGYFPSTQYDHYEGKREFLERQATFIIRLFDLILIPILVAMTIVLLIWAMKIIVTGEWPVFAELSGIITSYVISGLWLHFMVTKHEAVTALFYKKIFPICGVVILMLGFLAWAKQLNESALKADTYVFILIWAVSMIALVMLHIKKGSAHPTIAIIISLSIFGSVFPIVGYHVMPVRSQLNRLEQLLISEDMFDGEQIIPADDHVSLEFKEDITDAVLFIVNEEEAKLPKWVDGRLSDRSFFESTMGFEWALAKEVYYNASRAFSLYLELSDEVLDISTYDFAISLSSRVHQQAPLRLIEVTGKKGQYELEWRIDQHTGIPNLRILESKRVLVENDFSDFLETLEKTYQPGHEKERIESILDMSLSTENERLAILLVFKHINITVDVENDKITYYFEVDKLYIREK